MSDFKKWLRQAYREPHTRFTEHNMEVAYLAGQASVEQRVKELEQERDEAVRQWERFERMAGDNWAALKAQAGEPVAWQHRQRGLKEYEWQEWQTVGYKPQGPESQTFQMRPLFTHPTTERPYNPLNDYAVIPMNPTEPVKAQAGEPPRVDPNWVNIKMDVSNPTTERRVMEMALEALESVEPKFTEHHEAIEALRNALNAAPAKPAPSVEPEVIKEKAYNTLMDSLAQKNAQIATALQAKLDVARSALEEIEYNGDPIAIKALAEIEAIK